MDEILERTPKKKRTLPINKTQKDLLLEFMKNQPDLRSGRFTSTFTFKKARELWMELAEMLNAIPNGSNKDWRQWRKTWQDCKKNTKAKVSQYNNNINKTGGGPPPPSPEAVLDGAECQILDLLSNTEVNGLSTVTECGADFFFIDSKDTETMPSTSGKSEEKENARENESHQAATIEVAKNEEVGEDLQEDHTYNLNHPSPSTNRMKKTPQKLNKTRRLENSLKISQNLLKSVNRKDEILEHYYTKKIEYLEHKKKYELKHLALMGENNDINKEILATLNLIFEKMA